MPLCVHTKPIHQLFFMLFKKASFTVYHMSSILSLLLGKISLKLTKTALLTICQFALPECLIESLTQGDIPLVLCTLHKLSQFPLTWAHLILLLLLVKALVW